MKKIILLSLLIISCDTSFNTSFDDYTYVDPWENYSLYLSESQYNTLLTQLTTNINRSAINNYLDNINVRQDYSYSFYSGTTSDCHTLTWKYYSSYSYDWIYYRSAKIWVHKDGSINISMCSYYIG